MMMMMMMTMSVDLYKKSIKRNEESYRPLVYRPYLLTRPAQHCTGPPYYTITNLTLYPASQL